MANERWTAAQLPDLSGQTVVVTGASSGIGAVTAGELSRAGAKVVLGVRDVAKGEAAAARMAGRQTCGDWTLPTLPRSASSPAAGPDTLTS